MIAALAGAAAIGIAAVLAYLWRVAPVGCGYKAKILCSGLFVSGRDLDSERAPEISSENYRILRLFRARVDRSARRVTVTWLGLRGRTAVFREGVGAALVSGEPPVPANLPLPAGGAAAWPRGEASAAVSGAVERVFTEPDARKPRRTRAVLVAQAGRLIAERYAPGFGPGTRLCGWSMTKSALSALIGIRVGEGKLALGATALLPEWSGPGDPRREISLEDLLRMRSGLAFSEKYADPLSDVNRMLFMLPDAGAAAAVQSLAAAPGRFWKYSSGASNILSGILRRSFASDEEYWNFPRRALFDPLGMESAVFETDAAGNFVGSSYLFAAPPDWLRFGQLFLQDGVWEGRRILPEGWVRICATPTPQSPEGRYGAHWWLKVAPEFGGETPAAASIPADAFHAFGHEGQALTVIPSRDLVALRMGLSIQVDAWDHAQFLAGLLDVLPA